MVSTQDAIDRAEHIRRLAEAAAIKRADAELKQREEELKKLGDKK
jgi:hypothetical protein